MRSFRNACRAAVCAAALALVAPAASAQGAPAAPAAPAAGTAAPVVGAEAQAQRQRVQPGNNAPAWRAVNSEAEHVTTLPRWEGGRLIQTGGESWRQLRNGPVTVIGGWALVAAVVGVALFFALKGQMKLHGAETGRRIERFTLLERTVHWALAISFVLLAVTGILLLFGKHVVLPVIGATAFSWIAIVSKVVHNYVGPLFAVTVVATLLVFLRDNIPNRRDLEWVRKGGGMFTGEHVPSHRFNAGEKTWFWVGVFALGIAVSASGFVLDFPNFEQTRATMQLAWTVHAIGALLFMLMSVGHIYMGTIGMQGSYRAMRTGYVDETWAKEHHQLWYDDIAAGRIPARRSGTSSAPSAPSTGRPQAV
ncbi:MAG TPA: formate dehydrogenase subunit gamma [Burkholderiaceae bacterium]|nr:formate dehydrogenase subunit gamma [Burkholderiaceae bacterium]